MRLFSTYSVKIKHYNHIFKDTVCMYRDAVDFLIFVCLNEWSDIDALKKKTKQYNFVEHLCHSISSPVIYDAVPSARLSARCHPI